MDEGAPGAEVLDSNDDMDEDNEIPVEIPQCSLTDFKKQRRTCVCVNNTQTHAKTDTDPDTRKARTDTHEPRTQTYRHGRRNRITA